MNDTTDPGLRSWVPVAPDSDFPIQNLPLGVFRTGMQPARIGVAIGERIADLHSLADAGLLDDICARSTLCQPTLNEVLGLGRDVVRALRARLSMLLRENGDAQLRETAAQTLLAQADARMQLPCEIGDYVDFYSSLEHATNLGRLFRPNAEPLLPNWRWLPVGYHGRSATIVVDGTPIVRPNGQRRSASDEVPSFSASSMLDIELEVGFFSGRGNAMGVPIAASNALEHIAGLVLVNDWSARDIQAWEYQPLGPFLGKSFATTISPWVVTLDALEPFRTTGPAQIPAPLPYLSVSQACAYDIELSVEIQTEAMRAANVAPHQISRTNFATMYWNMAQQLAHATANGAVVRAGDMFASGTVSGSAPNSYGSLIELTWRGERPLELPSGERRGFLQDGDEIVLRGWCERSGARRIGFGIARGRIAPAPAVT